MEDQFLNAFIGVTSALGLVVWAVRKEPGGKFIIFASALPFLPFLLSGFNVGGIVYYATFVLLLPAIQLEKLFLSVLIVNENIIFILTMFFLSLMYGFVARLLCKVYFSEARQQKENPQKAIDNDGMKTPSPQSDVESRSSEKLPAEQLKDEEKKQG